MHYWRSCVNPQIIGVIRYHDRKSNSFHSNSAANVQGHSYPLLCLCKIWTFFLQGLEVQQKVQAREPRWTLFRAFSLIESTALEYLFVARTVVIFAASSCCDNSWLIPNSCGRPDCGTDSSSKQLLSPMDKVYAMYFMLRGTDFTTSVNPKWSEHLPWNKQSPPLSATSGIVLCLSWPRSSASLLHGHIDQVLTVFQISSFPSPRISRKNSGLILQPKLLCRIIGLWRRYHLENMLCFKFLVINCGKAKIIDHSKFTLLYYVVWKSYVANR